MYMTRTENADKQNKGNNAAKVTADFTEGAHSRWERCTDVDKDGKIKVFFLRC